MNSSITYREIVYFVIDELKLIFVPINEENYDEFLDKYCIISL